MPHIESAFGWAGPERVDVRVTNRCGATVAVGDLVMLDVILSDAASTSNAVGVASSGLANIIFPTAGQLEHGLFGVVQKVAVDDAITTVRLKGAVDALNVAAAIVLATAQVTPTAASPAATSIGAAGSKIVAIPLAAIGAAGLVPAFIDGINGFGKAT